MHIYCLGLNHTTTNISLRERLAFSDEAARAALARLAHASTAGPAGSTRSAVAELVIVSTCNRTELYAISSLAISPAAFFTELEVFLAETRRVPREEFHPHLYRLKDEAAVRHLLEVAAGLDSLVIGEPQILGQITHALELARGQGAAGSLLNRLFQMAIHAGKRARTETAISQNPASISSLAASLAAQVVNPLDQAQVVVLGAGEMAELAVEALRKRGARRVLVVNRTLERARLLADRWQAQAATFESLDEALCSADILISSTGAPHILISSHMVRAAMQQRLAAAGERPLIMIDIAVPRDIDPDCVQIPHVSLYDIDNLNAQLEQSLASRVAEVPHVLAILDQEQAVFMEYLESLEMLPLIVDLRQRADAIRQAELEKTLRRMPNLSDADRRRVEALSHALVKKLLDAPTHRLRAEAACPHATEYATVARTLFGLEHEHADGLCGISGQACPISPFPSAAD